jgi:signal transduction histidine kinase
MDNIMASREQTILVVSDDAALCAAVRRELEDKKEGLRVAAVSSVEAARRIVEEAAPAVILLEEAPVAAEVDRPGSRMPRLETAVAALAVYAPVVVIGAGEQQAELAPLVAAGAADYVVRTRECLAVALGLVERRLRQAQQVAGSTPHDAEDFGEVLRHELNNPLTGILGNAELLLAEVRRKNDGRLPQGGQQRLETIAALAVRLRETIRRLSQEWEVRRDPVRGA